MMVSDVDKSAGVNTMTIRIMLCASLFVLSAGTAFAQEQKEAPKQEETFTDLTPGSGMLEPGNLASLVQQGDVRAMNNVGLLWAKGFDGKQSYEEAIRWWNEAARRGYTVAMNNLGLAYANGHGVESDMKQAFDWWLKSAFGGNAWAMNAVGDCYETGQGVERDYVNAMTWYQTAADAGDALAHYNVGALYEAGNGVERDYAEALMWYRNAARQGDAASMQAVARFYREGLGVQVDLVEAYAWHQVADIRFKPQEAADAEQNRKQAAGVAAMLSPSQREQAAERFKELELQTSPPEPEKPLDPGETRT